MVAANTPLTTFEGIKLGDVLVVARKLRGEGGRDVWWRRFVCVTDNYNDSTEYLHVVTLKLHIEARDGRVLDVNEADQIVTWLPPEQWPDGVVAIRMKWIHKGLIKLDNT